MLTGTYPHEHGVPRNGYLVNDSNQTVQEHLKGDGWQTAAFVGGFPLDASFGLNQGFDHYDDEMGQVGDDMTLRHAQRDGAEVNKSVFGWLDSHSDGDKPTFLFVHYFDVHLPYISPAPYHDMYVDKSADQLQGTVEDLEKVQRRFKRGDQRVWKMSKNMMRRYAGGVSYADKLVGDLVDGLKERNQYDSTLIVLTSDHGETMDEHIRHEVWSHGYTVFDTAVHTPLIISGPGLEAGRRVQAPVSSIDVTPTILDFANIVAPHRIDGVSLKPGLQGEEPFDAERTVFSEATKPRLAPLEPPADTEDEPEAEPDGEPTVKPWANRQLARSARTSNYKYMSTPHKETEEFYDLLRDPGEQHDLTQSAPDAVASPARQLANRMKRWGAKANPFDAEYVASDESAASLLEALGYVDDEEAPVAPDDFAPQQINDDFDTPEHNPPK